jgi:hypothetical protein
MSRAAVDRIEPAPVGLGPGLRARGRPNAAPQQELAEAMPRLELVLLGRFPGAHEVAQGMRSIGDPHRGERARAVAVRQLDGVAPIRLHPVAGLGGDEGRGDDVAADAQPAECQ